MTEQHNHPFIMAHQSSSAESDNQVPPYPFEFDLKSSPQSSKDSMLQQEQETPFNLKDVTQSPSASKTLVCNKEETELQELLAEDSGREKLKRHRVEVAGRVWIPDMWGQEDLLKDWIDCSAFDAPLVPSKITMAREALVGEGRRANAAGQGIPMMCTGSNIWKKGYKPMPLHALFEEYLLKPTISWPCKPIRKLWAQDFSIQSPVALVRKPCSDSRLKHTH